MSQPERTWISDLAPGLDVEEAYAVSAKEVRQRRNGGPYLALTLSDRTGAVAALAWENVERIGQICESGRVVRIRGQVQRYNQRLQVVVRRAESVPPDEIEEDLFVRSASLDPELLWGRLHEQVDGLANPHLKQLLYRILADPDVAVRLRKAPAARGMHHAWRAGLLEHTVSVVTVAAHLAEHYRLDRDMVVAGTILHDLGKVWELEIDSSIEYTDDGRLLGHIALEVIYVDRRIAELASFPAELRRQLLHLLLAHHGQHEYGSPQRPKTPEALLVHMVDNLDSKMAGMLEAMAGPGDSGDAWSAYSRILERHVYLRRPPTSEE